MQILPSHPAFPRTEIPVFDLINGLPVHPLVVHAVVVLAPLVAIGLLVYLFVPRWRLGLRWPLAILAVVAAASAYIAKESGERFERRVGDPGVHAEWGDRAFIATGILMIVALVVLFFLVTPAVVARTAADGEPEVRAKGKPLRSTIAIVLTVVAAVGVFVTVYEAGDSGAKKVWSQEISRSGG